eukprot:296874_1
MAEITEFEADNIQFTVSGWFLRHKLYIDDIEIYELNDNEIVTLSPNTTTSESYTSSAATTRPKAQNRSNVSLILVLSISVIICIIIATVFGYKRYTKHIAHEQLIELSNINENGPLN